MTRVVVLGAFGLLGTSLVRQLEAGGALEVLRHGRNRDADLNVDLLDPQRLDAALDQAAPDVIVNLAALTDVDLCEREPQRAYLANVRTVENVAAWVQGRKGDVHLIQVSTDQVYDGAGPHAEGDVTLSNYYGFSKYAGELAAMAAGATVLRTNFVGKSELPGRTSLSDWLVASLRAGTPITVFDDIRFSPLSMKRLTVVVEQLALARQPGLFNLGSRNGMSKADFAFDLAAVLGLSTRNLTRGVSRDVKFNARRPADMTMNSARFEHAFGVELPTFESEIHSLQTDYANEA